MCHSLRQTAASKRFRIQFRFHLNGTLKHADLLATGEDSAAAWINGKQVMETVPLPPLEAGALEDLPAAGC